MQTEAAEVVLPVGVKGNSTGSPSEATPITLGREEPGASHDFLAAVSVSS